jgi:hypothetical protein
LKKEDSSAAEGRRRNDSSAVDEVEGRRFIGCGGKSKKEED